MKNLLPTVKKVFLYLVFITFLLMVIWVWKKVSYYQLRPGFFWRLIVKDFSDLKQFQNRSNILLLGIGGVGHDSGDLTDTIMVASINLKNKDVVLLSIPRDIWIPSFKDKLNAAYRYGEDKIIGSGLTLAKSSVEEVIGIPIHYAVLIDFESFTKMIDTLGGVEVKIDETFTDKLYPIKGKENDLCDGDLEFKCRYESVTFAQGQESMDGQRALKYVRSRHAEGNAGTDFSRGRRQQTILMALKNKLLTRQVITDLKVVRKFINDTNTALTTDMNISELIFLGQLILDNKQNLRTTSLTQDDPEKDHKGLLVNPPLWQYDGKWVLIPKSGDFKQIFEYVSCFIEMQTNCERLMD